MEENDLSADGLWRKFKSYEKPNPREGRIAFWFTGKKATHVAICEDDEYCFTADGGGSRVKTVADAWKYNAFIKTRPIFHRKSIPRFVDIFLGEAQKKT
jgi:hypothetical protein